jgi:hypothetical protein
MRRGIVVDVKAPELIRWRLTVVVKGPVHGKHN